MIISDKNRLIIEFDGRPVSLDRDDFRCYFLELTNRCNAISSGVIRFLGGQDNEGNVYLMTEGHSLVGSEAVVKYSESLFSSEILFSGYVSSVSSSNDGGVPYVEFMVSSPEFWLLSGRNIIPWEKPKTYADILDELFSKYSPKLGNYSIDFTHDLPSCLISVHGSDENDYDYVKRIANQTGSLFYSVDGSVLFQPIRSSRTYSISFDGELGNYVKEIKLTSNLIGIPKTVSISYVRDDDHENPVTISTNLPNQIGNGSPADSITSNIDESTSLNFINMNVDSDASAKYLAQAEHKRRSLNFIKCEILCDLTPTFKAGSSVLLSNFNSAVDNRYILTSITHKFENTNEGGELTTKMILNSDSIKLQTSFW